MSNEPDLEPADYVYLYWIEDMDTEARGSFSDPTVYGPWKTLAEAMPVMDNIRKSMTGDVRTLGPQYDELLRFVKGRTQITLGRTAIPCTTAVLKLQTVRLP